MATRFELVYSNTALINRWITVLDTCCEQEIRQHIRVCGRHGGPFRIRVVQAVIHFGRVAEWDATDARTLKP